MRQLLLMLLFLPAVAFGALTFDSNHQKEMAVLRTFDIDPAFLKDPILNRMKEQKSAQYHRQRFFGAMDDAYLFIPLIKQIMSESNLPGEFLFLAMAESNFSTKAYSKKSASGLWQFMTETGRLYGLKIDDYVDERRDLVKSTRAAVRYLSYLHDRFGKWYLAAIAYNCGEGRLARAIQKAGSDELSVLLDKKKCYIPRESRYYIRKIVALALLGTDESYLIDREYDHLLNRANAYSLATVKLARGEKLSRVAKLLDMPLGDIQQFNRHLKHDFTPPYADTYEVYIPYVKLSEFRQKYKPEPLQRIYLVHTVQAGDNLSKLGKRYGISYQSIVDFNNLRSNMLSLKQQLVIPVPKNYTPAEEKRYTVKAGDTLGTIAEQFRVTVRQIKRINHLDSNTIRIGEKLSLHD